MKKMISFVGNLLATTSSVVKVIVFSKKFRKKPRIHRESEEIVILANGPSMKERLEDEKVIQNFSKREIICVNHFCESDFYEKIKPSKYIIAAPEMYQKEVNDEIQKKREYFWKTFIERTNWEVNFFIPYQAKKNTFWLDAVNKNSNINVHYYNIIALEGFESLIHYYYKRRLGLPRVHNIVGYTIMNVISMGYKRINLLGVEHSWLSQLSVTEQNIAQVGQPHLYDPDKKPEVMYKDGKGIRKLHEILHKFYLAFSGYWKIRKFADRNNVEIYNLTKGSYIDAFERKDFDDIL